MKFAKELENDLVPEWRVKYLDYKAGKKQVKIVARAVAKASGSPRSRNIRQTYRGISSPFFASKPSPQRRRPNIDEDDMIASGLNSPRLIASPAVDNSDDSADSEEQNNAATPMLIPGKPKSAKSGPSIEYGSFIPTAPSSYNPAGFKLPGPAIADIDDEPPPPRSRTSKTDVARVERSTLPRSAYEVGPTIPRRQSTFQSIREGTSSRLRQMSMFVSNSSGDSRPFMQRMMSGSGSLSRHDSKKLDMAMEAIDLVRTAEKEFFKWMDKELDKIETFYKSKEDEAGERLKIIREQLHEMRNRRIEEIAETKRAQERLSHEQHSVFGAFGFKERGMGGKGNGIVKSRIQEPLHAIISPMERAVGTAFSLAAGTNASPNSRALQEMNESPEAQSDGRPVRQSVVDNGRDYVRRPRNQQVSYRAAKRKLKLAMKEFYRGLELLKSYALLNRTAFRKINKKYDKTVNAHPPLRYMSEKVNKAYFVESHVLEGHIHAVEDLYARYFERGNHKVAVGKLRCGSGQSGHHDGSAFRCGILIGTGAVFAVQGVIYSYDKLINHPNVVVQLQTSYLLQIYAGYFLALYLFAWFCIDCYIWDRNRINYVFIFELDPRHHLDWRQLSQFPSLLMLVLGLFVWLNFSGFGPDYMYIYYPVILIFLTALLILVPAPIIFYRSRLWFAYSHWRLLLAGLYPVEFRDFFLGDMYCSLTYVTSNIELFFCLYATHWNDPPQCNSGHSRLLGFFSALPAVWRALQCIRRYYDTGAVFPHLANLGKYSMGILYYVTLSIYRIQGTWTNMSIFVTFAVLNSIYTSLWDLFMDWSLGQPDAKKRYLRDVRGYSKAYYYYVAMVIDVILRFNWIFYPIFTYDAQHSTIVSFFVAFSEVTRRAMWTLFRVENEHCANVSHFKASRDIPLPYVIQEGSTEDLTAATTISDSPTIAVTTSASPQRSRSGRLGAAEEGAAGELRQRPVQRTLTRIVADAHMQDFEKKRKPVGDVEQGDLRHLHHSNHLPGQAGSSDEEEEAGRASSDEEYGDEDAQSVLEAMDVEDIAARTRRGVNDVEE